MFWPAVTPPAPFFVIETSTCALTVVFPVALLFALLLSFAFDTVAVSLAVPPFDGAVIVNVMFGNVLPLAITALDVQVIVPPDGAPHVQFVPDPLAPVTPAGSVLTTIVVPLVGSGPLLVICTVYVSVLPAFTLIGALTMMARSVDC